MLYQVVTGPSNTANVDDLVESCAELTDNDRDELEIEFHHAHLPALRDTEVIDFDEQSGKLEYYRDPFIEEVLDVIAHWEE